MARKGKSLEMGKTASEFSDSVQKWFDGEIEEVQAKKNDAENKVGEANDKIDKLNALTEQQKRRKCTAFVRKTLARPTSIYGRLAGIGDDISMAFNEGHKPYWIQKQLEFYNKRKGKLEEALMEARNVLEKYPDIAEAVGGLPFEEEVPSVSDVKSDAIQIVTTPGVRSFKFNFNNKWEK